MAERPYMLLAVLRQQIALWYATFTVAMRKDNVRLAHDHMQRHCDACDPQLRRFVSRSYGEVTTYGNSAYQYQRIGHSA